MKEQIANTCYNKLQIMMMDFSNAMLSERNQTKYQYCMISFIGNAQKRQIHRDRT